MNRPNPLSEDSRPLPPEDRPDCVPAWEKYLPRPFSEISLAALSGLLLGVAFLYPQLSWFGWVALAPLFLLLRERDGRGNFLLGMVAGLIWFLIACHWLRHVTWVGWIALGMAESVIFGILLAIAGRFHARWRFFVLPMLWVAGEMVRSKGSLGFSWNLLGHLAPEPLVSLAQVWGVYGLSFLLALSNVALATLVIRWVEKEDWLRMPDGAGTFSFLPAIWLAIGFYVYLDAAPSLPTDQIRVGAVQGNFEQSLKWQVPIADAVKRYIDLTNELVEANRPELVVWPEVALPTLLSSDPGLVHYLKVKTLDWRTPLVAGVLDTDLRVLPEETPESAPSFADAPLFNSAYFIDPNKMVLAKVPESPRELSAFLRAGVSLPSPGGGGVFPPAYASFSAPEQDRHVQVYDKARLLQFGEYVPFSHLLPFVQRFVETRGGGAFSAGQSGRLFDTQWGEIGTLICFESTFSGLAREAVLNGAEMLMVLTNDAWFLKTAAADQHALQSRFRAIETGRAVVRVANTGLTRLYLPNGEVEGDLPAWSEGSSIFQVPLYDHLTFHTRVGDFFGWLCLGCLLISLMLPSRAVHYYGESPTPSDSDEAKGPPSTPPEAAIED